MAARSGSPDDRAAYLPDAAAAASLRPAAKAILAGRRRTDPECRRLLADLRKRCPDLLPADPLRPGDVGPELELNLDELAQLVPAAAEDVAGASSQIVWTLDGNELLVHLAKVTVRTSPGLILVTIPVHCDEVREAQVLVPFAVGDSSRPAGLVAVTEDRPRGPVEVVELWGGALTSFAWAVVLRVSTSLAGAAGEDLDGAPLVPAAIAADQGAVRVLTQARHEFDRLVR